MSFIIILAVSLDFVLLVLSFVGSYFLRFNTSFMPAVDSAPAFYYYLKMLPVLGGVFVYCMSYFGMYKDNWNRSDWEIFGRTLRASSIFLLFAMGMSFLYRGFSYSRLVVLLAWPIATIAVFAGRLVLSNIQIWLCHSRNDYKKILIAGNTEHAVHIYEGLVSNQRFGCKVVGFVLEAEDPEFAVKHPVAGTIGQLPELLEGIDELIVAIPDMSREKIIPILLECQNHMVSFKLVPDILDLVTNRVEIMNIMGIPVLGLKDIRLHHLRWRIVKRIFDLAVAGVLFVLSLPLWIIIAIMVKLDSRGPVFFVQERCSQSKEKFNIIKFRTMRTDAEEKTGPVWASEQDDRRTRIGTFLRSTNLDELPQLWNVIRGDMSLVGPRPERPHFIDKFKYDIPQYMYRHMVKSGITGWAQVNGLRGNTPLDARIRYDLYYIENWSVFLDIKILVMTAFARTNAY